MRNRLPVMILSILLFGAYSHSVSFACTDPSWFTLDELPETDLLIRATVFDTDDRNVNAVLRVKEYFKGEGPLFLPVVRYPVALATGSILRAYDTSCLYSGYGYHRWRQGDSGYFGLQSNGDGTFTDFVGGTAHFFVRDGYMFDENNEGDEPDLTQTYGEKRVVMTESEFVALLLQEGGRETPLIVDRFEDSRYPLMRFLMIATEKGTQYQLNPDRSVIRLRDDAPIAVSPDGAHVAMRVDGDTIRFQDIWHDDTYYSGDWWEDRPQVLVTGRDVMFSKNSNLVAVWDDRRITVYMFHNSQPGNLSGYGRSLNIYEIATLELAAHDEPRAVTWSDDSSTVAWQDGDKIWRWNLYDQAEAQLVSTVSDADESRLLDLSLSGRFLRIGSPGDWTLVDSQTGDSYENAVVSPNEQFLGFFSKNLPETMVSWHDVWHLEAACAPPLRTNCARQYWRMPESVEVHIFPYELEMQGSYSCTADGNCEVALNVWDPSKGPVWSRNRNRDTPEEDVRQVISDPRHRQVAVLRGDYQIELDFYHSGFFNGSFDGVDLNRLDYVNFEGIVDSPIASIEWGQPIFYDTFMLTATEYLALTIHLRQPPALSPRCAPRSLRPIQ